MKHFRRLIKFSFALLILASVTTAYGQAAEPSSQAEDSSRLETKVAARADDLHLDREYFKGYLTDTASIISSPLRWDKKDWLTASLVLGAAAGFYVYDEKIHDWTQERRGGTTDGISRFAKPFGEGQYVVPALGLFYLYGYTAKDGKAEKTALLSAESLLISSAFTQALKYSTHRQRPEDSNQHDRWDGPSFSGNNLSFASGESTAAFSIATVIASEYEAEPWVAPLAYGIATLAALARINDNAHWASDVLVGSAIGHFTAKAIVKLHRKQSKFALTPEAVGGGMGLNFSYNFD